MITVIDVEKINVPEELLGQKFSSDFYSVILKEAHCGMQYGRNYFDFDEGVLVFTAPGQVVSSEEENPNGKGWMLFFHPDLIRHSNLGMTIHNYSFFSYDVHEALHLSKKEEDILNDCVAKIEAEYEENIDGHSQSLFASNLELILNYCNRFYERQFHTRKAQNQDVVSKFERTIRKYYEDELQYELGTPTVHYMAEQVHLSANYLSDLLKKETGRNGKDHINEFVVDKAKTLLLNSNDQVAEIAYDLGYNYPHYFSRVFKQKTGMTPHEFRELKLN